MAQKAKDKPSGFRKGFLLNSSKPKRNRIAAGKTKQLSLSKASSSALLNVADHNPFLVVTEGCTTPEQNESKVTMPLHLGVDDHYHGSFGQCEDIDLVLASSMTTRNTPLIREISSPRDSKTTTQTHPRTSYGNESGDGTPNEPLLEQRQTIRRSLLTEVEVSSNRPESKWKGLISERDQERNNDGDDNDSSSHGPINAKCIPLESSRSQPIETHTVLAHEYTRVVWNLRRRQSQDGHNLVGAFIKMHVHSDAQWAFVWDSTLESISQHPKDPALQCLGVHLLSQSESACHSLMSFLSPTEDVKHSRVLALGAACLLNSFVPTNPEQKDFGALRFLLKYALPKLVDLASSTKRSLLSQTCMNAAYNIIARVSEQIERADSDVRHDIWQAVALMDQILQVQEQWVQSSMSPTAHATPQDTDVSRKRCTLAVIADWKLLLKQNECEYDSLCLDTDVDDEAIHSQMTQILCQQLAGTNVDSIHVPMGGIFQTLCGDAPKVTASDVLTCLQGAVELMRSMRGENNPNEKSHMLEGRLRAVIRGVAAWLGQSKKHLHSLLRDSQGFSIGSESANPRVGPTLHEQAIELSVALLRSNATECVELILSMLGQLWSTSHGLPLDITVNNPGLPLLPTEELPPSFQILLHELKAGRDGSQITESLTLEPTERALCFLVAKCIGYRPRLFKEFLAQNGLHNTSMEVAILILSDIQKHDEKNDLSREVGKFLFDNTFSSRFLQNKMLSIPDLFCNLPLDFTVPYLIELLANVGGSESVHVTSSIVTSLTGILEHCIPNLVDDLIRLVVDSLLVAAKGLTTNGNDGKQSISTKICNKFGAIWQRALLHKPACGDSAFAEVLAAISREMFRLPSSDVPLTLLGTVVGNLTNLKAHTMEGRRVGLAMVAVLKQSLNELSVADKVAKLDEDDRVPASDIFRRLSPLLLLRRIPTACFQVVQESFHDGKVIQLLSSLADQLAARLAIDNHSHAYHQSISTDERRIAAELAGRCLPLFSSESCSCFHRFCIPAFSAFLEALTPSEAAPSFASAIRMARTALYVVCHHFPLVEGENTGDCLVAIGSFVLTVLEVSPNDQHLAEYEDDIIQIQTGCIEFIALCLESTLGHRPSDVKAQIGGNAVVAEVDCHYLKSMSGSPTDMLSTISVTGLNTICVDIISTLSGSTATFEWRSAGKKYFNNGIAPKSELLEISPAARTCLWNAFLVVSQRCDERDDRLTTWARLTAPWVLKWGSHGRIDSKARHPLCMAAALQITFVLITRTKSFACLGGKCSPSHDTIAEAVRRAHGWALESIKSSGGNKYACGSMRMAALKLILAIVSIDLMTDIDDGAPQGHLSPSELHQTFSVLRGAANVDADPDFRKLAGHIMSALQAS